MSSEPPKFPVQDVPQISGDCAARSLPNRDSARWRLSICLHRYTQRPIVRRRLIRRRKTAVVEMFRDILHPHRRFLFALLSFGTGTGPCFTCRHACERAESWVRLPRYVRYMYART